MATEKMEIQVTADVNRAVAGIDNLSKSVSKSFADVEKNSQRVEKALKLPIAAVYDSDKAIAQAMAKIEDSIEKSASSAISDIQKLNRGLKTTEEQFKAFGGLRNFIPPNIPENFRKIATSATQVSASLPAVKIGSNQAAFALTNLGRVAQDAPFGFIAIQNNINPLLESFQRLKAETGSTGLALKALAGSFLGPAGIGVAVSLATSALTFFLQAKQKARSETKALKEEEDVYVNTLAKESVQLKTLFSVATSANVPLKARTEAVKELRAQYGAYLKDFSDEEILAGKAAKAYEKLAAALINVARAKAAEAKLVEISTKQLENEEKIAKIREKAQKDAARGGRGQRVNVGGLGSTNEALLTVEQTREKIFKKAREEAEVLRAENALFQQEAERLGQAILKNQVEPLKQAKEESAGIVAKQKEYNVELQRTFTDLSKIQKLRAELIAFNQDPTQQATPNRPNPINIQRADRTSSIVITPEALRLQGQYGILLDEILEKQRQQQAIAQQLSDTINNGINAGIDTFFNAIANNQDPFEALAQSAKRLVVELAAAVVKALVLQAITNAIAPGSGAALGGLSGGGGGVLDLILRGDLLTGAIGGNATRRRRF